MKYLAIDYGSRRIGIAASDPTGIIVRPVTTIDQKECQSNPYPIIKELFEIEKPQALIVGLPLDQNMEETETCAQIRSFIKTLTKKLTITIPIHYQDESYSTVRTHNLMKKSKKKKRSNKNNIDKVAACIILEDYIRESSGSLLLY